MEKNQDDEPILVHKPSLASSAPHPSIQLTATTSKHSGRSPSCNVILRVLLSQHKDEHTIKMHG